jgi:hypothetical protein
MIVVVTDDVIAVVVDSIDDDAIVEAIRCVKMIVVEIIMANAIATIHENIITHINFFLRVGIHLEKFILLIY